MEQRPIVLTIGGRLNERVGYVVISTEVVWLHMPKAISGFGTNSFVFIIE